MKVIELLNKIANGEGYPKIKFNNSIYEYHDKEHGYCRYYHNNTYICLDTDYYLFDILNDEVEIIEEPQEHKIPEKLSNIKFENGKFYLSVGNKHNYIIREVDKVFLNKINEILDYLEKIE